MNLLGFEPGELVLHKQHILKIKPIRIAEYAGR